MVIEIVMADPGAEAFSHLDDEVVHMCRDGDTRCVVTEDGGSCEYCDFTVQTPNLTQNDDGTWSCDDCDRTDLKTKGGAKRHWSSQHGTN